METIKSKRRELSHANDSGRNLHLGCRLLQFRTLRKDQSSIEITPGPRYLALNLSSLVGASLSNPRFFDLEFRAPEGFRS